VIDPAALLRDLRRELATLEDDLREQTEELPELRVGLRREHGEALRLGRTAETFIEWRDEQVTQAGVAWLLACVFVRFCEDNRLVRPVWLAGPEERRAEAADAHTAYFGEHPERNDRDWLLEAFRHLEGLAAAKAIFDREHNPLWRIQPSADAAERLAAFWRRTGEEGRLAHDFTTPDWDTRFLGDLYQDLSEAARKRYALLQTPEFVEEFILDRTLERAIAERGLDGLKLIDPACGSGHFLLGTFKHLMEHWHRAAPGMDTRERVQVALDAIHGVDLNPFSVAIARFRLTVAALRSSRLTRLEDAPAFRYHLAVGDSLLHGHPRQLTFDEDQSGIDADAALSGFTYATEDLDALRAILVPGQYDVVVANPPYITVKDKALNKAYRQRYKTCKGKYALSVPFCERLFQLACKNTHDRPAGWVGQITANSFMKREFGTRLVHFLSGIDLLEVVDTSGAYIPGHGTPTVILVGRTRRPRAPTVRTILGIRGEPSTPADASKGFVWRDIVERIDQPGTQTSFVGVSDLPRELLHNHPWTLAGGGAIELKQTIEQAGRQRLKSTAIELGITGVTGEDDLYVFPDSATPRRLSVEPIRRLVVGDTIRDWTETGSETAVWLYSRDFRVRPLQELAHLARYLWIGRTLISKRHRFGTPMLERGLTWYEWQELHSSKLRTPLSIAFAFVATHNHFVLDRGEKVFNRSAPLIKLPEGATEDEHLRLLGLLNSSTACFWLKQVSHNKGSTVDARGARQTTVEWENFYEFTGTKLEGFPLPGEMPLDRPRQLDRLAQELQTAAPQSVAEQDIPTRGALDEARGRWEMVRAEMIAAQEELDWGVYRLYGLLDEDMTYPGDDLPKLALGERASEIVLARRVAAGEEDTAWFQRHGSMPRTEVPEHWPTGYRELVQRRIDLIAERPDLALIERPECKRRWATKPWAEQEREALREWLLDRLEDPALWADPQGRPQPRSVAQLADRAQRDPDLLAVLTLLVGRPDYHLAGELGRLLADEAVPYLTAYRYTAPGLRKRGAWEEVWAEQRREDAGEQVGQIPVPPKYAQADFARNSYWRHRGKLDVPKERFIAYPGAERDTDQTGVYGWAGWDHLEQARALATLVVQRAGQDGWEGERLLPLLAGLAELEPWLHQWHAEPDPEYGGSPADYFTAFLSQRLAAAARTREDLAALPPPTSRRGRRSRRTAASVEGGS
jgi:Domain of unknown function (DUF7008)/Eco57I restriction-modification methylase